MRTTGPADWSTGIYSSQEGGGGSAPWSCPAGNRPYPLGKMRGSEKEKKKGKVKERKKRGKERKV